MAVLEIIALIASIISLGTVFGKIIQEKTINSSCMVRSDNDVLVDHLKKNILETNAKYEEIVKNLERKKSMENSSIELP